MGLGDKLKSLFGGAAKPKAKKAVKSKGYNPPSDRAAILAEAMKIHQRERGHAQGVLEDALKEMIAKPPKPSDVEAMTRLLTLRQAVLAMKQVATSDSQRGKVLEGVKGLMKAPKAGGKGSSSGTKR